MIFFYIINYSNEILIVSVSEVKALTGRVMFEDLDEQLLTDKDVTSKQLGTMVRRLEQLLSKADRHEGVQLQGALFQSLKLQLNFHCKYTNKNQSLVSERRSIHD